MEKEVQPSFIPKQALSSGSRTVNQPIGLFLLLALLVLIIALLFLGGAYAYRFWLADQINRPCPSEAPAGSDEIAGCGLEASLVRRRESLSEESILGFETLDKQLRLATEILEQHQTVLPALDFLARETLQSIRYTSFNQTGATLDLRGVAKSYEGVALQSIALAGNQLVKDFVFSDVNADQAGNVSFSLKLTLDSALFSYVKNLPS